MSPHKIHPNEVTMAWSTSVKLNCQVIIGQGARAKLPDVLHQIAAGSKVLIMHQAALPNKWLAEIDSSLFANSFQVSSIELPDGEKAKSQEWLTTVWTHLQELSFDRTDTIVAIGGGAVCDLAGFAASTYLRGIKLVMIPTTLLAQVDAAIGGKTAINLPAGKNLAGTFYYAHSVIIDPHFLSSLSKEHFVSGLGEIVKYALIEETVVQKSQYRSGPRSLLDLIENASSELLDFNSPLLPGIIATCVKMKLAVVGADPMEGKLRRILNLGHTLGHAVEKVSGYEIPHGQSVSIGLIFALRLSHKRNLIEENDISRVSSLLSKLELPTEIPSEYSKESLMKIMMHDKKKEADNINFVLPQKQLGIVDYEVKIPLSEFAETL